MRARLATLALLGALLAPPPGAADASDAQNAPAAPRGELSDDALSRGLLVAPAWALHATVASVFLVAAVALGRRARSRR